MLFAQPWRWIDHPSAVADAAYKPRQLRVAARCGLNVPRSLVTNVGARVREFATEVGDFLVYKSLSTGVINEQDEVRIIYTSRLTADDLSVELDPALADAARRALASVGLSPAVHAGDGGAGLAAAAPFDRIISTAATDHIPSAWISQLTPGGVIVVDLRGSLTGSLLRLTAIDPEIVEGVIP